MIVRQSVMFGMLSSRRGLQDSRTNRRARWREGPFRARGRFQLSMHRHSLAFGRGCTAGESPGFGVCNHRRRGRSSSPSGPPHSCRSVRVTTRSPDRRRGAIPRTWQSASIRETCSHRPLALPVHRDTNIRDRGRSTSSPDPWNQLRSRWMISVVGFVSPQQSSANSISMLAVPVQS